MEKQAGSADHEVLGGPARAPERATTAEQAAPQSPATLAARLTGALGNRGFARLAQAKLEVGAPDDSYEQEADRAADGFIQRSPLPEAAPSAPAVTPWIQRVADDEETEPVQARADGSGAASRGFATDEFETRLASATGGEALSESVRLPLEDYFGRDLSSVRIHEGAEASALTQGVQAQAFTHGTDIYFGSGRFEPGTSAGRHLLAHELTHALQQSPELPALTAPSGGGAEHEVSGGAPADTVQRRCAACGGPTGDDSEPCPSCGQS